MQATGDLIHARLRLLPTAVDDPEQMVHSAREAIGIEQAHEQLEVRLLAVVRGRREQQQVPRVASQSIGELAPLGLLDLVLTIRVEIEADHRAEVGFGEQTIGTVSENARTLRLRDFGWDPE